MVRASGDGTVLEPQQRLVAHCFKIELDCIRSKQTDAALRAFQFALRREEAAPTGPIIHRPVKRRKGWTGMGTIAAVSPISLKINSNVSDGGTARAKAGEAVTLYRQQKTVSEIAMSLGIGRGSVYRALEAAGLKNVPNAQ